MSAIRLRSLTLALAAVVVALLCASSLDARSAVEFRRANSATTQACAELKKALPLGRVSSQGLGPDYLSSVQIYYNQLQAKKFPACVVYPTSSADVQTAIKAIKKNNVQFAIKAGGHQFNNGWSAVDQGILIDLRRMTRKSYDAASQTGFFEPGNRWRDSYAYFAQWNMAPVGGRLGGVGSGLALGGGLSYLSAQYGLACDGFVQLDVVLADGSLVAARADNEHADLFKALKGGGNRFGVVTGYHVKLRPTGTFYSGVMIYEEKYFEDVVKATLAFNNGNDDPRAAIITTVDSIEAGGLVFGLAKAIILFNVYDGANPGNVFKPFEDIPHIADTRTTGSYLKAAEMLDVGTLSTGGYTSRVARYRPGSNKELQLLKNFQAWYAAHKGEYILATIDYQPVAQSVIAAGRAAGGNALDMKDGPHIWVNLLLAFDPNLPAAKQQALIESWKALEQSVPSDEDVVIFMNDAGDQPILQSYGTYPQLQATSRKYDPSGLFLHNQEGPQFSV